MDNFQIIDINNMQWNSIVKSFNDWDIYYTREYNMSLKIHGDGDPLLFYYHTGNQRVLDVAIKNDISDSYEFLKKKEFYDLETPYGYGGPLIQGSSSVIDDYYIQLKHYCIENNIVSEFIRFHPLLKNDIYLAKKDYCTISPIKETIYMKLDSTKQIMQEIDSKNRNMIRKAIRNEIEIFHDGGEHLDEFYDIYTKTMKSNQASEYYYFNMEYFNYLKNNLNDKIQWFYAKYQGNIISSSIILFCNNRMHYHLSGTLPEYKNLAANNLLLYNVAIWGSEMHFKTFHLGGGISSNDSLFNFKKKFNKNGNLQFYIGKFIFNEKKFNELIKFRAENDVEFDSNNKRLITYRG